GWNAFFFPKGTPAPIVRRLNQATSEALDTPSVRERMQDLGTRVSAPEHRSPEYLATLLRSDIERGADRIKAAGIAGRCDATTCGQISRFRFTGTPRLLRARRERARRCAAEQRDELAPPHSITSSARASSVGGISGRAPVPS